MAKKVAAPLAAAIEGHKAANAHAIMWLLSQTQ